MASGSLVRGGQVIVHNWTMLMQIGRVTGKIAFWVMVLVLGATLWFFHANNPNIAHGAWLYAKTYTVYPFTDESKRITYTQLDGRKVKVSIGQIRNNPAIKSAYDKAIDKFYFALAISVATALIIASCLGIVFYRRGVKSVEKKHIKGSSLVKADELKNTIKENNKKSGKSGKYELAGIPWPAGGENLHTLIVGSTGTGKTVAISELLDQIIANGDRAIVYDKLGSFIPYFYEPEKRGDVILNPFDARDAGWELFREVESAHEFYGIADALIPEWKDVADPFWTTAARLLFASGASSMWERGEYDVHKLTHRLIKMKMDELAAILTEHKAPGAALIDKDNPKTALSVRAILSTFIQPLDFLRPVRHGNGFSIREWVQDRNSNGLLFLSSQAITHESRRAQIATQIDIALKALQSMPKNKGRKLWFIIDELPSLQKIPSLLRPGIAEVRQFSAAFVISCQVFSEVKSLYGREDAISISGNCNTRLVLSSPDRDTAQWMSDGLGRELTQRMNQSFSYGADSIRDGVSHTMREDSHPIVFPADIMRLPVLKGFLKMPHDLPTAEITLKPREREMKTEAFMPRLMDDNETHKLTIADEEEVKRQSEEAKRQSEEAKRQSKKAKRQSKKAKGQSEAKQEEATPPENDAPLEPSSHAPDKVDVVSIPDTERHVIVKPQKEISGKQDLDDVWGVT